MELTGFLQIWLHSVAGLSFQSRIWVEMPLLYPFKSGGWLFQKIFQHMCPQICLNFVGKSVWICADKSVWSFERRRRKAASRHRGWAGHWSWRIEPFQTISNYPLPAMPMTMIPAMTAMTMKKTHTRINTNTNILILADITISNYQLTWWMLVCILSAIYLVIVR